MELLKIYDEDILNQISKKKMSHDQELETLRHHVKEVLPTLNKSKINTVDVKGHDLTFFTYWNKFLTNKKLTDKELNQMIDVFASNLSTTVTYIETNGKILDSIACDFRLSQNYCHKSGKFIVVYLTQSLDFYITQSQRKIIIHEGKEYETVEFVPLTPIPYNHTLYEKIVDFPSGHLLINDYFDCGENAFRKAMDKLIKEDYSTENSINFPRGKVKAISECADLDFVSVNVGNTSPDAFQENDTLFFGKLKRNKGEGESYYDRAEQDPNYLGMVCTGLWNVSVIDEVSFLQILLKTGVAPDTADKYLEETKQERWLIQLKVNPGKYRLTFCGRHQDFNKMYRKKHKNKLPEKYEPYFILEKV